MAKGKGKGKGLIDKRFPIQEYEQHGYTQPRLSELTGYKQPNISKLARSDLKVFVEVRGEEVRIVNEEPKILGRDFSQPAKAS